MRLPAVAAALSLLLPAAAAALTVKPCSVPGVRDRARCGTLEVWENRETKEGRRIGIHFVVVPAKGPGRAREAVAFFSGGPGQAATDAAGPVTAQLARVRDTRDLLFMDQRGTGASNPLPCKSARPADLQTYLTEFYTPADVARCARALRARADVTWYDSAAAMDDMEELRDALGYQRLDLFGVSYGTRAALVYLRRHPAHVRAVLMHGSAPTDLRYPLTVPRDAQLALDGVFADCARDPGCHAAFPDPGAELEKSLRRLGQGPVRAPVLDPASAAMTAVMLSRDRYTEALRALAYDAGSSSLIPAVIHRAAEGDFGPAAEEELAWRREVESQSRGVHLAVTCAEDVDFIERPEAVAAAEGSFMGPWRALDQMAACAVWPHRKLARSFLDPVRSDVPLLVMNGEDDPATARYHAERLLRGFPNGRLAVIPSAGHGTGGLVGIQPCYDDIVSRFIRTADAKAVDTSCLGRVHRPPFPTAFPGGKVVRIDPAALRRFAGRYAGPAPAEIRLRRDRLHALVGGEDLLLLPVGPTRFRLATSPHVQVEFREKGGAVTAFDVADGGAPVETYVRAASPTRRTPAR
ncbi:MAG TPA: alpha/beta fold hydrolase [Myxococcales bacterium]